MKPRLLTILFGATAMMAAAGVDSLGQLADRLSSLQRYEASATYSVLLPSALDEVVYTIDLQSSPAGYDPLSDCDYLIEWSLPTPSGQSTGFSAYANGSHYRYRDQRLQEYHYDWDSIPFLTGRGGVQRNAQFVDILPQVIASKLRSMEADANYAVRFVGDTICAGRKATVVHVVERVGGYTARELCYVFDHETCRPISINMENNPGEISEQSVEVKYLPPKAKEISRFTEDELIARFPEIFERYRRSNFRIENLPGSSMPAFSLPRPGGGRLEHARDERFATPMIIAVIDPDVATAESTVTTLRESVAMLPFTVDIIWALTTNNADIIDDLIGTPLDGETVVMSVTSLVRDCGITAYPTIIFVGRDGKIKDVQLGFNKNLSEIVIQKTALMAD